MKKIIENFRAFMNEDLLVEQKHLSNAAIYKFLGLPQYLGNAAIGTAMFRNGKFLKDFTAEEVTSTEFKGSVDKMDSEKLKMLIDAAHRYQGETGKIVAAVVISPSFCAPGSHPRCVQGACKEKLQEFKFSAGSKCTHLAGGDAMKAPGVLNFIWFVSCDGVGGVHEAPQGAVRGLVLTLKGKELKFVPGGSLRTNDFVDGINDTKRVLFKSVKSRTKKSDVRMAKILYKHSPYGKAENKCNKIFQPGIQPAPFGIIDKYGQFGFGDGRVWNFKCVDKNNVILTNADDIKTRLGKEGFARTKQLPKCNQKQKICMPSAKKEA